MLAVALVAAAGSSSVAGAQATPSDAEVTLARELFREGVAHVRANEWPQARTAFERAYALVPRPSVLLNLAAAQVQTGRLVAGAESYRRFLREVTSGPDARRRPAAERALQEVESRIPRARIEVTGQRDADRLLLDGSEISTAVTGVALPVDPGDHELTVERDGETVGRTRFTAVESQEVSVHVRARSTRRRPAPIESPTRRRDRDDDDEGSAATSPILWTAIGVAVVGGVVAAIVLLSGEEDPYSGNVPPGVIPLP